MPVADANDELPAVVTIQGICNELERTHQTRASQPLEQLSQLTASWQELGQLESVRLKQYRRGEDW